MFKAIIIVILILLITWTVHLTMVQRCSGPARDLAMDYFQAHQDTILNQRYLTIIDFTKPSYAKRMFIYDLHSGDIDRYLVAHGRNSGYIYADSFSNQIGSYQSCQGFFLTGECYRGDNGPSMYLYGLEEGINDNAFRRSLVLHGASWVSYWAVLENGGRLGRSLGCPAVSLNDISPVVDKLRDGSLMYIHALR